MFTAPQEGEFGRSTTTLSTVSTGERGATLGGELEREPRERCPGLGVLHLRATKAATTSTIPIVFAIGTDLVEDGLVENISLTRRQCYCLYDN